MVRLQGGMGIVNPVIERPGTLGLVATHGGTLYIVSCYHVLSKDPFAKGEPILRADGDGGSLPVAFVDRGLPELDVAAAMVAEGVEAVEGILGLGRLALPAEPMEGMPVVKIGHATGRTEGRVSRLDGDDVWIVAEGDESTTISEGGDSGAVWVCRDSLAPVVLHTGSNDTGMAFYARGVRLMRVLGALDLTILSG